MNDRIDVGVVTIGEDPAALGVEQTALIATKGKPFDDVPSMVR